ncbi:MAG: 16S rRNA (guanine(527)-N(7))-methyltransferase RsmG [Bauldia sp.]
MAANRSPQDALRLAGLDSVSRETIARLERFVALVEEWNPVHNLMSRDETGDIWVRHIADSAQLVAMAPSAARWLDIGSGGGFPGVVVACLVADRPNAVVHLVESNSRKVAFLRAAKRSTGAPIVVHSGRIEDIVNHFADTVDAVSARALASLDTLCGWIEPIVARGAVAWLHKGADFASELADTAPRWTLDLVEHPSRIGSGVIVEIRSIERTP